MSVSQSVVSLSESVDHLNELIVQRKLVDGIDIFYADDVAMVEAGGEPMIGRDANRERERAFEEGLTAWNAHLLASAVDESTGTAFNEWVIDYDHAAWGAGTLRQVAVQKWRDGQIVREVFYKA